jgi:hypothetical protein
MSVAVYINKYKGKELWHIGPVFNQPFFYKKKASAFPAQATKSARVPSLNLLF